MDYLSILKTNLERTRRLLKINRVIFYESVKYPIYWQVISKKLRKTEEGRELLKKFFGTDEIRNNEEVA